MNWTTEKPTTPGWYAWRIGDKIDPFLSRVFVDSGVLMIDMEYHSWEHIHELSEISDREWLYVGPAP